MMTIEPRFRREAIRELMERDELNASGFAVKASVQRTLIGGWLAGVVTPQVGTLTRLCRVFNVPITFFFDEGVSEPAKRVTA